MIRLKDVKDWKELKNKVVCGDCLEGMKMIPDKSIDMVLTSPPYDNLRDYKGFKFDFENIAKEIQRILKDGGVCVWIVGDATVEGSETGSSFRQALYFMEIGMNLHDTMIYQKNTSAFPSSNRYEQVVEYMFILSSGTPRTVNLIKDKKNAWAGTSNFGEKSHRGKDGKLSKAGKTVIAEYGMRNNIWKYATGFNYSTTFKQAFEHPAIFPEKLAQDHVKSWSNEGDMVLDPMMGSFTTARACKDLGRDFIGFELDEEYCKIDEERLKQEVMF